MVLDNVVHDDDVFAFEARRVAVDDGADFGRGIALLAQEYLALGELET